MFALLVLAAADFLVVLDGLIVSVALPSIQRDLGVQPGRPAVGRERRSAGLWWGSCCWVDVPPTWWGGGGCSSPGWWCSPSGRWRVAWPHRRGCWWPLGLARGSGAALTVPAALALLTATLPRDRPVTGPWPSGRRCPRSGFPPGPCSGAC